MKFFNFSKIKKTVVLLLMFTLSGCDTFSDVSTYFSDDSTRLCEAIDAPPPPSKMDQCRVLAAIVINDGVDTCIRILEEGFKYEKASAGYLCNSLELKAVELKIHE